MPGLMSGDWKRSTVSGPQRLQPVRGQRRTYRLPRQPSTLTSYAGFNACFATFLPEDDADVLGAVQRPLSKITNVLAGHLSMITRPRVVADVIREAADATWESHVDDRAAS